MADVPPHLSQVGFFLRITGFPTTTRRDLDRVMATLNLYEKTQKSQNGGTRQTMVLCAVLSIHT